VAGSANSFQQGRAPSSCATRDAQAVHQCPVVVLATGKTAATWVLAVLAHAACAVRGEEREAAVSSAQRRMKRCRGERQRGLQRSAGQRTHRAP